MSIGTPPVDWQRNITAATNPAPTYIPPWHGGASATVVAPDPSPRAAAEAKVEAALATCATEPERALLVHTLTAGLDWTRDRAKGVLLKAGWWLT